MKRLTERDGYGNADIIGVDSAALQLNLDFDEFVKVTDALNLLAFYEDTGLTPEEIIELNTTTQEQLTKAIGVQFTPRNKQAERENEKFVIHCNTKENAELIAEILNYDAEKEIHPLAEGKNGS